MMCNLLNIVQEPFDFESIAAELLRFWRGKFTQSHFSRRLGYRSNIVHSWEAQVAFPTAAKAFLAAAKVGIDVPAALSRLQRQSATSDRLGLALLLQQLRGNQSYSELAKRTGHNRFQVSRWLNAETEPRLPDFLRLVHALSFRLLDFLADVSEPSQLASVASAWRELEQARRATYGAPWSQAVLRVLETVQYQDLPQHDSQLIAQWLKLTVAEVERALDVLVQTSQAQSCSTSTGRLHYQPTHQSPTVDTRRDPQAAQALREFWAGVALQRMKTSVEGLFSHNLIGVSKADLARIVALQKAHYQQVRAIVAESQPVEKVVLLNLQLVPLV